ncbi:hypothetical protein B0H16DRAFT_1836989 [Mycena metata]|uniref:BHLH domain-containing protein n=1 Tax=Mycena metata TaxID=1033252 RepID=A0AAD7DTW2_9AGAR|nr:hypothetical protein B0H16DRAFT_1836989 [Mycena metata]
MLTLMNDDLGLDPSDPLNLLLHNHSQHNMQASDDDSSPSVSTPPDWNSLSSMWPAEDKMDEMSQFTSMDLGMGIDTADFGLFNPFQFTFEAPSPLPSSESESGGSTGSFSPPPSIRAASVDTGYSDDPAAELANRVRKNAGLVLAIQIGSDPQYHPPAFTAPPAPSYPPPINAAPAFTTAPVAPSAPPTPATPVQTATQSRPNTSHTTIERRYRTNLNARIQSLRQAVPALRVVDRAAAIKAGEPYSGGDASDEDHIDARGFVDGVKVARKCSKANVLGKAVEYIRVLKNREKRLTRELEGLKTLLRGLWEREWVGAFGGGERDEVGVEDGGNGNEDDADEDEEGESDDEGGGGRKRKKAKVEPAPKVKVERKPAAPVQEGEKKKRGRPRKVAPLPASATASASTNSSHAGSPALALSTFVPMHSSTAAYAQRQQEMMQQHQQDLTGTPRQYLLGAFALFSFFANANVSSPSSSPPPQHQHEGHVLTPVGIAGKVYEGGGGGVGGMGLLQAFHLLASAAVLVSVVWPVGRRGRGTLRLVPPAPAYFRDGDGWGWGALGGEWGSLSEEDVDADASEEEGMQAQAQAHREAEACILDDSTPLRTRLRTAFRLYATSTSTTTTSRSSASLPSSTETADDRRCLLALLVRPVPLLGARVAPRLWEGVHEAAGRLAAMKRAHVTTQIHTHTLTRTLTQTPGQTQTRTPTQGMCVLRTLEAGAAVERLCAVGGWAFVREVLGSASSITSTLATSTSTSPASTSPSTSPASTSTSSPPNEDADASTDTLAKAAASEREMAREREREREEERAALEDDVLDGEQDADDWEQEQDGEQEEQEGAEADVEKLLSAFVLYRRVFGASASSSSPASASASANPNTKRANPSARTSEAARALRRTLGSSEVFEDAGVEEARDRVVDLLSGEVQVWCGGVDRREDM